MMRRVLRPILAVLLLAACSGEPDYEVSDWELLIDPAFKQEEVVDFYKKKVALVPEGSKEEVLIYAQLQAALKEAGNNKAMDGKRVRLSGYIVPVDTEDDRVTRFLFFPNQAACIHVPASPANQTIYVKAKKGEGVLMEDAYENIYVYGGLRLQTTKVASGTASFVIDDAVCTVIPRL